MRVLHIIDHMGLGGAQALVYFLTADRADRWVYALGKKGSASAAISDRFRIRQTRSRYDMGALLALRQLITAERIELVHCHLVKGCLMGYLLKTLFFPQVKLVFHEEGRIFIGQWWYRFFLWWAQSVVNVFIAVSRTTGALLTERAGISPEKITVVYPGIDGKALDEATSHIDRDQARAAWGIGSNDFAVGFAARLIARKGWRTFIEAAGQCAVLYPSMKFVIAGDGPDLEKMHTAIHEQRLSERVIYVGRLAEMASFYTAIDCLVIPSVFEPFPVTLHGAQTVGRPVIISDVGGQNELLSDRINGLLFPQGDPQALARCIGELATDPVLGRCLSEHARAGVEAYFVEHFVQHIEHVYTSVG